MEELRRRMASAKSWGVEPVSLVTPAEVKELVPFIDESMIIGGFYTPGRRRRRLAARRHAHARGGPAAGRAHGLGQHRGARHRRGTRPRAARTHHARRRGGRGRGDLLRRLEPAPRADGRRVDPAHAGGAPDDRHRPGAALRGRQVRIEYPIVRDMDAGMYERQDGERARGRLLRPPADPARPRRDPLHRGGGALPHRAAVHAGRLRPADGARARVDAGDRGGRVRGHQVRDQRPALAHAGRPPDPRRDPRDEGAVVGRRGVGEGGAGRRARAGRVDGRGRVRDRPAGLRRRPLLRAPARRLARAGARVGGLQQDLRHRPPRRAVGVEPRRAAVPLQRARA